MNYIYQMKKHKFKHACLCDRNGVVEDLQRHFLIEMINLFQWQHKLQRETNMLAEEVNERDINRRKFEVVMNTEIDRLSKFFNNAITRA